MGKALMGFASDNDARRVEGRIGFSDRGDDAVTPAFGWTEVDEKDLILLMVDDAGQGGTAAGKVGRGKLALENGELQMVAEAAHELEDFAEAPVVADVVADEMGGAHVSPIPN